MSDFNWTDDAEDIVLTWQPRTAAYRNIQNGVVIRQEADALADDHGDDQVFLTPMGALQMGWRLIELAHECGVPVPPRKLMTQPLDLGPQRSLIPLTHPEPVPPGPLLTAMERDRPANDGYLLATAANRTGRPSPKVAAE